MRLDQITHVSFKLLKNLLQTIYHPKKKQENHSMKLRTPQTKTLNMDVQHKGIGVVQSLT